MAGRPRKNLLGGSKTEWRVRKYLREVMERRYKRGFEELLDAGKKRGRPGDIDVIPRIEAAGTRLLERIRKASDKLKDKGKSILLKLEEMDWVVILQKAMLARAPSQGYPYGLPGNIKGAIRELVLGKHENMKNLLARMGAKLSMKDPLPNMAGKWQPPERVSGAVSQQRKILHTGEGDEIGDHFVVAYAGKPPPRWKGKQRRIWIMSIVESKSPTNLYDAFEQLRRDVARIKRDGIWINGKYYHPDEIVIDLPTSRQDPDDWITELIAAVPKEITSKGAEKMSHLQKGTIMNVWLNDMDEEDLDFAVREVHEVVKDLLKTVKN
jgi:hypothetical protein